MTQLLQAPRNLSPMWLDLAHVIAGEPTRVIIHPLPDAPVARCAAPRVEVSAAPPAAPQAARMRLSWPTLLLAQASGAALTAALMLLLG
ncbi:hypothetical protein, partial [Aquabacterium sp.]|uniref:hypothetical protein n=1 Tax=Aquabacterium sp. TaxID=1872578 RepID=UPI002C2AA589